MSIERDALMTRTVNRKSARLFVIACEGEITKKEYFEGLIEAFDLRRVQVKVLESKAGKSSSLQVVRRMNAFVTKHEEQAKEGDEFWLVMDVDHGVAGKHRKNLERALILASKANYFLAVSHPRVELWLVLHWEDCPTKEDCATKDWLEKRVSHLGGFNPKKRVDIEALRADGGVVKAIERSKALDLAPDDALPDFPGTRIYRLMESIRRAETRPTSSPPF